MPWELKCDAEGLEVIRVSPITGDGSGSELLLIQYSVLSLLDTWRDSLGAVNYVPLDRSALLLCDKIGVHLRPLESVTELLLCEIGSTEEVYTLREKGKLFPDGSLAFCFVCARPIMNAYKSSRVGDERLCLGCLHVINKAAAKAAKEIPGPSATQ